MELKKGDFYLGRDLASGSPVIYDSADLTTHAVIVGMTGSGKTGLGIDLIEEALLSGVSCLVIDPKGDMGNLGLVFPELAPGDFEPWVDASAAAKEGKTIAEMAETISAAWKAGLTGHGIDAARMRRLRDTADVTIYTPGSGAGVGLNVLGSMRAPDLDWSSESEVIRDEIAALVSSLLVLAGIESDPVSGQEHILLATIIEHFWKEGKDLDLATLVAQVPKPPFRKMGVFEIDTFFPEKARMELALRLNGLLASPSFASWMEGRPLDIDDMIGGDRPRAAIVYLSHLSDEERQFLVTLLLGKTVTWIRAQPGTSKLRALVYMDEVFGFAPPTREPPSKKPILTIMKQARAHGVGMVLSTQNPVDLDYKAMANAGTWMIGRLQTENDKRRILEGLASAAGNTDIELVDKQISGLEQRQFLLHSTKGRIPTLFTTRWAMSYLAGPLTRERVTDLMGGQRGESPPPEPTAEVTDPAENGVLQPTQPTTTPPEVADGVTVSFLDPAAPWAGDIGADPTSTVYEAAAAAVVQLVYDEAKADLTHQETYEAIVYPLDGIIDPDDLMPVDHDERDFLPDQPAGTKLRVPDLPIHTQRFWSGLETDLKTHLVANRPLQIWANPDLDLYSRIGENEEQFRQRCASAAEAAADAELAALRDGFQRRLDRVRAQLSAAQARYQEADAIAAAKSEESVLETAGDLLGAFLGGKSGSSALSRAAGRRSATARAEARADKQATTYRAKAEELARMEAELATELDQIVAEHQDMARKIEKLEIPLEKTDVRVATMRLLWIPVR